MIEVSPRTRFEQLGAAQVWTMLDTGSLPSAWTAVAFEWLSEQDMADRAASNATIAEQARLARSANRAAWIAAVAAIVAAIIAIVAAVIAYFAWVFPHAPS